MMQEKYIKELDNYLKNCNKEELAKVYKEIEKKIIDYIIKGE